MARLNQRLHQRSQFDGSGIGLAISSNRHCAPRKIIAMSGGGRLGNQNILTVASEIGADTCLEKPFEAEELLQLLCQY